MTVHSPKTREQRLFLENVERAQHVGITTSTSKSVYHAILCGLSYVAFNGIPCTLTDDYLVLLQDMLADEAVEQGKYDAIKWVGFIE